MKQKSNCYVVVNCGENPCFGGQYETPEDVFEAYDKYPSFTGRVFSSLRAANKERDLHDQKVAIGEPCFVVCGCYCKQYAELAMLKRRSRNAHER